MNTIKKKIKELREKIDNLHSEYEELLNEISNELGENELDELLEKFDSSDTSHGYDLEMNRLEFLINNL